MLDFSDPNSLYILLAVVIGILAGFLLWRAARRRPQAPAERRDHLAEHQVPTQGTFARVSQGPLPPAQAPADTVQPRHDPVPSRADDVAPTPPARGASRVDVFEDEGSADDAPADRDGGTELPSMGAGHDGSEPNDIAQEAAAATADVVGELLGVGAHNALAAGEDELQTMKGVGPKLAAILRAEGLTRFAQIAALTPDQRGALDAKLGAFKGRLARDRVVEQAGYLARGDREGYERAFGKL